MTLKRWHWIAIILTTIALVVMAPSDDGGSPRKGARSTVSSSSTSPSDKQSARSTGRVELELLSKLEKKQQERSRVSDVFNQTSWYVAPPPPAHTTTIMEPVVAAPPPVQIAPQLPFTYLGRFGNTETRTVILAKGEKVYTVKQGDIIENMYRVEKFTLGTVNLTYLPLNILQSLRTGEAL